MAETKTATKLHVPAQPLPGLQETHAPQPPEPVIKKKYMRGVLCTLEFLQCGFLGLLTGYGSGVTSGLRHYHGWLEGGMITAAFAGVFVYVPALAAGGLTKSHYATRILFPLLAVAFLFGSIAMIAAGEWPGFILPFSAFVDCSLRSFCAFYCQRTYFTSSLMEIHRRMKTGEPGARAAFHTVLGGIATLIALAAALFFPLLIVA